jgi:nucleoside-diphosphate-sugar epimerase
MHVLVTGAAGFLGRRVIDALLQQGTIIDREGKTGRIERITAFDVLPLPEGGDHRVHAVAGDIADPAQLASLVDSGVTSVFHLAAIVSGQAEAEFDLGMRINLDATRALLERIRAVGSGAKMVMTSSVAVFGGDLPQTVADSQVWEPKSSYGTEKAINDLLLAEYSRRGWVDGRSLRMPTIVVRPGKPNRAASSFASGIIREPVAGHEAICPVSPETVLWLMSPALAVRNILHGHDLAAGSLGARRVINMPGLSITVAAMLDALRRVCGAQVADRVRMVPDPAIEAIVNSWPGNFAATYAKQLGFTADEDFDSVVRAFLRAEEAK